MSNNNTLVSALTAALAGDKVDLDALVKALSNGTQTVVVKPNRKTATYTRVDGETVPCTPKQAKAWASRVTLTPEQRAERAAKQEEFVAKKREWAAKRAESGKPARSVSRFANRAAAEMVRLDLASDWQATRDAILAGVVIVPDHVAQKIQG